MGNKPVQIKCEMCDLEYIIPYATVLYNRKHGNPILCKECSKKNKAEILKQVWANRDDSIKKEINHKKAMKAKAHWDNLSDDEKASKSIYLKEINKTWRDNQTDEERQQFSEKCKQRWDNTSEKFKQKESLRLKQIAEDYRNRMTEEDRIAIRNKKIEYWLNRTPEEKLKWRQHSIDSWNNESLEYKKMVADRASETFTKYWKLMDKNDKLDRINKLVEINKNIWDSLSYEDRIKRMEPLFAGYESWWNGLSQSEKEDFYKPILESLHKGWKEWHSNMTSEEKQKYYEPIIEKLHIAQTKWIENLSPDDRLKMAQRMRVTIGEWWDNLSPDEKKHHIHNKLQAQGDNSFMKRFRNAFESFNDNFSIKNEFVTVNNDIHHSWDYAIFRLEELICLVDLDGAYYHADGCDYDGMHSRLEYDERRGLSIPDGVKWCIIQEKKFDECMDYLYKILPMTYDEFIDDIFKHFRAMPFPYPRYEYDVLLRNWADLVSMDPYDKYHDNLSLITRLGDHIIFHYHTSLWSDKVTNLSPQDIWKDDKLLLDHIRKHMIYQSYTNPNKILQGFNVSDIAPRVPVFSAATAKMIICRYLDKFDAIFDPNPEYSGRMIGTICLDKEYIGFNNNEVQCNESNDILNFLHRYQVKVRGTVTNTCMGTKYPALFTEVYSVEQMEYYLTNFQCERYVFIAPYIEKYFDNIEDLTYDKYVIIINKDPA